MDIAANLGIRPWEIDQLTVIEFYQACDAMQKLRDEVAEAKAKAKAAR